jgi:hypothetical protein
LDLVRVAGHARTQSEAAAWLEARAGGVFQAASRNPLTKREERPPQTRPRLIAEYEYRDQTGMLLYVIERREPKAFSQKVPDGKGRWNPKLNGVRRVPYRLRELLAAIERNETIYVVEGEEDVETLVALGLVATTSSQGAGWKWPQEWSQYFRDAPGVIFIPDCDEVGRNAVQQRAGVVAMACDDVQILELDRERNDGFDISDWISEGHTVGDLTKLAVDVPRFQGVAAMNQLSAPALMRMRELLALQTTESNWLVEGLLPDGGTSLVVAKPKVGKSTLTQNLALAVARGEPFLGRPTTKGPVVYLAIEDKPSELARILRMMGAHEDDCIFFHCDAYAGRRRALAEADCRNVPSGADRRGHISAFRQTERLKRLRIRYQRILRVMRPRAFLPCAFDGHAPCEESPGVMTVTPFWGRLRFSEPLIRCLSFAGANTNVRFRACSVTVTTWNARCCSWIPRHTYCPRPVPLQRPTSDVQSRLSLTASAQREGR